MVTHFTVIIPCMIICDKLELEAVSFVTPDIVGQIIPSSFLFVLAVR